jgi:predicted negative regulator of RcsB-dependent stress response
VQVSQRDAAAAAATFQRVIGTRHPEWAAAAMVGLAGVLMRGGDPEGAEALYRKAVEAGDADWSAHASSLLGDVLEGKGDVAGAALDNPDAPYALFSARAAARVPGRHRWRARGLAAGHRCGI